MDLSRVENLAYPLAAITILILMAMIPFFTSFQSATRRIYMAPIKGSLGTDSYECYPYPKKDLEIGFSRYGEFITPQNASYIENGQVMGRGLSYDGHEAFACPDDQNMYYPVEGWLLQYSYLNRLNNNDEHGIAYALYSDLDDKLSEAGRTQNLLAEPIKIKYNSARRFVAEVNVHILNRELHDIITLKQTIVYNKVSKHVVILMDVEFLESSEYAGPLHLNVSRRVSFKLAHSLTSTQGKTDHVYTNLQHSIETPYEPLGWQGNDHGYYDLVRIYATSLLTGGSEYTGFVAFWPNVTDSRLYGWNEWNKAIEGHEFSTNESKPVFVTGEWDVVVQPGAFQRFVVVYGIIDGNTEDELQLQVDSVFDPWSLSDAILSNEKYMCMFVGRDAPSIDFASAAKIAQEIPVENGIPLGFDMLDPDAPEIPFLIDALRKDADQLSYFDSFGRLHLNEKWAGREIVGSAIVILGGVAANLGTRYFNDYMDIFLIDGGIYASGLGIDHSIMLLDNAVGYAVVGVCQDPNGTSALIVWGITAEDTWHAACYMYFILERLLTMPSGITAVILEFNYAYPTHTVDFLESVRWLGTITEFVEVT